MARLPLAEPLKYNVCAPAGCQAALEGYNAGAAHASVPLPAAIMSTRCCTSAALGSRNTARAARSQMLHAKQHQMRSCIAAPPLARSTTKHVRLRGRDPPSMALTLALTLRKVRASSSGASGCKSSQQHPARDEVTLWSVSFVAVCVALCRATSA